MPNKHRGRHLAAIIVLAAVTGACPLCQNLRNEFLSFRGAYFCEKKDCAETQMVKSSKGSERGDTRISYGKVQPYAALVFNPGAQVETFSAKVTDCKGKTVPLPDSALKAPGSHGIKGEGDSWVVMLDKRELSDLHLEKKGKCAEWIVTASATWPKGTSYEDRGGVKVE